MVDTINTSGKIRQNFLLLLKLIWYTAETTANRLVNQPNTSVVDDCYDMQRV